jgi:hypothetical protein
MTIRTQMEIIVKMYIFNPFRYDVILGIITAKNLRTILFP